MVRKSPMASPLDMKVVQVVSKDLDASSPPVTWGERRRMRRRSASEEMLTRVEEGCWGEMEVWMVAIVVLLCVIVYEMGILYPDGGCNYLFELTFVKVFLQGAVGTFNPIQSRPIRDVREAVCQRWDEMTTGSKQQHGLHRCGLSLPVGRLRVAPFHVHGGCDLSSLPDTQDQLELQQHWRFSRYLKKVSIRSE